MNPAEYVCQNNDAKVTKEMQGDFDKYGYIMIRNFLDEDEMRKIKSVFEEHQEITKHALGRSDGEGRVSKLALWNHPGNDITGMLARCEKMVSTSEQLLGGEVYHYHAKLMMKEAYTGGKFVWHQDYGYWYNNGCLFPDMLTVFIAIDRCKKENGCLQILKGSHTCGRIDHISIGDQTGADIERVDAIKDLGHCPLEFVEMEPGDALFFHCNLLHTSNPNNSPHRRWAFLVAYNRRSNDPVIKHHHPCYTPLEKVPNSAIKGCQNYTDMSGKDFRGSDADKNVKIH